MEGTSSLRKKREVLVKPKSAMARLRSLSSSAGSACGGMWSSTSSFGSAERSSGGAADQQCRVAVARKAAAGGVLSQESGRGTTPNLRRNPVVGASP